MPHFLFYFIRKEAVYLIRFFKIRCHLGKEFVSGYADIYRIAKTIMDLLADLLRCLCRRMPGQQRTAGHIGESFINAILFYDRGNCPEIGDEFIGKYFV